MSFALFKHWIIPSIAYVVTISIMAVRFNVTRCDNCIDHSKQHPKFKRATFINPIDTSNKHWRRNMVILLSLTLTLTISYYLVEYFIR